MLETHYDSFYEACEERGLTLVTLLLDYLSDKRTKEEVIAKLLVAYKYNKFKFSSREKDIIELYITEHSSDLKKLYELDPDICDECFIATGKTCYEDFDVYKVVLRILGKFFLTGLSLFNSKDLILITTGNNHE